jgi:NADH dehydrogenase FAD-containing subunit
MVKNIVIVGGGSAGVFVAKDLATKIDASKNRIILITSSHRYVHLPSTLRAATTSEGQLENESFMEYGTNFLKGKGEVKHATVTSFTAGTPGQVKLSTGETVEYEVLLLATGNIWTGPTAIPATSQEEVKKHLDLWRGRIEKAKSIVLVGGGIVGAGESFVLDYDYPMFTNVL